MADRQPSGWAIGWTTFAAFMLILIGSFHIIAGLVAIASLGVIVGTQLDVTGYHRAAIATAVFLVIGAVISWIGIRNPVPTPGATGATPRPTASAPSTGSTHVPPHSAE